MTGDGRKHLLSHPPAGEPKSINHLGYPWVLPIESDDGNKNKKYSMEKMRRT